jgi:undecaprenyl-diphosphatase
VTDFRNWGTLVELKVLLAVLAIVVGTWAFIELADEVLEGEALRFDQWVLDLVQRTDGSGAPRGPTWLVSAARDITALGSVAVLSLITATVVGFLGLLGKRGTMWLMLAATLSGVALTFGLKLLFERPRPGSGTLEWLVTPSFPSGHSLLSALIYLSLGVMLARIADSIRIKVYYLVVAMLLTFLVGISRVYLGAHYPTDVLAGWTLGLVWASVWWLIARYLQVRGAV